MFIARFYQSSRRRNAAAAMVLNCGSSSVKYQLFSNDISLVRGSIENIGLANSVHKSTCSGVGSNGIANFESAIQSAIRTVSDEAKSRNLEIACVGHRVVHGGPNFSKPTIISQPVLEEIEKCSILAPLHNPSNIRGIEIASLEAPRVPHVACFDTAFHSSIPQRAYQYAIPIEMATSMSIRKYGFHGLSYAYISSVVKEDRMIVAHLGSGCSAAAIAGGMSVDTTMGFTPMEGLVMSTRSGTVDPGLILHLERQGVKDISNLLNKKSGLLGLSGGFSSDMKTLLSSPQGALAVDVFVYTVQKYIGQLLASLEFDVDAIAFTGGIGENSAEIRRRVTSGLGSLGLKMDESRNLNPTSDGVISMQNSKIRVYAVKTNEELQIARDSIRAANAI